ncbi:methylated-DNA--[protein]-cysteine S-methyltransferase [Budvicia diplopodorum]|uniref:methylated-DNA--[protein]-cysteine S-methyltransferase n=1 Tax=Budvicia diplopodorum TaxID=1119056 RepID=UPI00135ACC68|nr:methylated-DNA--[protein]-cysteine S-methyltransferase [Budvicia diplopodorum]
MYHFLYSSPVGQLRLVADDVGLRQLWLPNEVENRQPNNSWSENANHPTIKLVIKTLDDYFAGKPVSFSAIPCAPQGTEFQKKVWRQLTTINYAKVISYGDIAAALDNPKAVRAVGGAVGRNPIAIILPCHRVLGKDNSLTGYSGGLTVKKALLAIEGIAYKA